jgi:hypothetical protein
VNLVVALKKQFAFVVSPPARHEPGYGEFAMNPFVVSQSNHERTSHHPVRGEMPSPVRGELVMNPVVVSSP